MKNGIAETSGGGMLVKWGVDGGVCAIGTRQKTY